MRVGAPGENGAVIVNISHSNGKHSRGRFAGPVLLSDGDLHTETPLFWVLIIQVRVYHGHITVRVDLE